MGTKVTLPTVEQVDNSSGLAVLNSNLQTLADEFDQALYADGTVTVKGTIDMDSERIINLLPATLPTEPVTLSQFLSLNDSAAVSLEVQEAAEQVAADRTQTDLDRIAVSTDREFVTSDRATVAAGVATVAADKAIVAGYVTDAEAARDAAIAGANIYADTAAGIAGVADGEYFQIPSAEGGYVDLYKRNGAAADYIDTLYQPTFIQNDREVSADAGNTSFAIDDEDSRTAFALDGAGNAIGSNFAWSSLAAAGIDHTRAAVDAMEGHGLRFAVVALEGQTVAGQSLGVGSLATTALTTTQPYANVELNAARTAFVSLVEGGANGKGGAYERPMSAMANSAKKALIASIPPWSTHDPDFVVHNMAASNAALSGLVQGTGPYNIGIASVTAAKALEASYAERALVWYHGENDSLLNTDRTVYKSGLLGLHDAWNTDVAAITGQTERIPMFIAQMGPGSSSDSVSGTFPSAWAQLDAAEDGNEVYVVAAGYTCLFTPDALHYANHGSRNAAEYVAKAYHRYYVDGKDPSIVRPLAVSRVGSRAIEVTFFVPVPPLRFDLKRVFPIKGYGFDLYRSGTRQDIVTNVYLSGHDRVIIETSADVLAGDELRYASRVPAGSVGGGPFRGPRGNLFDSDRTLSMYEGQNGERYELPAPCAAFSKVMT